jgi:hypothetical protein
MPAREAGSIASSSRCAKRFEVVVDIDDAFHTYRIEVAGPLARKRDIRLSGKQSRSTPAA